MENIFKKNKMVLDLNKLTRIKSALFTRSVLF